MNTPIVRDETHIYVLIFHTVGLMALNCSAVIHPAVHNVDVVDECKALLQITSASKSPERLRLTEAVEKTQQPVAKPRIHFHFHQDPHNYGGLTL